MGKCPQVEIIELKEQLAELRRTYEGRMVGAKQVVKYLQKERDDLKVKQERIEKLLKDNPYTFAFILSSRIRNGHLTR